jgi:uncharacterized protein YbjT (DUF2867 family)
MAAATTTAFVTGGSGYVGRNLIRHLVARGDKVRALARSESAAQLVQALGAEPVRGDLDDIDVLTEGMRGAVEGHATRQARPPPSAWS